MNQEVQQWASFFIDSGERDSTNLPVSKLEDNSILCWRFVVLAMFEIAVIGAGVAGLTCAQKLHQAGRSVVVLDKSRGWGGRLATRRLANTHADHGVCYLQPKGELFSQLINELVGVGVLRIWTDGIHQLSATGILQPPSKFSLRYAAPLGATAIAKYLGRGLEVINSQQITTLSALDDVWQLNAIDPQWSVMAKQVVIATPPAQALVIAKDLLDHDLIHQISNVQFTKSLTAIAVFPQHQQLDAAQLPWRGIQGVDHPVLGWIGLDSSKQLIPSQPVLVIQSSGTFAQQHFNDSDLAVVGQQLWATAAAYAPGLESPELLQVHRWGYAFAQNPLPNLFLAAPTATPLYFCGDWCGGDRVESAFLSGTAVANRILGG
jgi:renalase